MHIFFDSHDFDLRITMTNYIEKPLKVIQTATKGKK